MSDEQFGFLYVKENCLQCHGCEVACKSWRNIELDVKWRRVKNIWVGTYPNVSCQSVSVSCMHCVEPACVDACPQKAIRKRPEDGIVVVDRETCIGCKACGQACPFGVPQYGQDNKMQKCDMCASERNSDMIDPPCVMTCPTQALLLSKMDVARKRDAEKSVKALVDAA
jgi:anaerobic dimethyl sulfoxide reductase subunit B